MHDEAVAASSTPSITDGKSFSYKSPIIIAPTNPVKITARYRYLKIFKIVCARFSAGAQATDPVSTFSGCVYTQQQPIVRRPILSETLKVLKRSSYNPDDAPQVVRNITFRGPLVVSR